MRLINWDELPQSAQDVHRKFENTFVKAIVSEISKEPQVIQLTSFDGDYCHVHYLEDQKSRRLTAVWHDIDIVEAWPPQVGSIPFFDKVLFLKRSTQRQWQVGLCSHNAFVWDHNFRAVRLGLVEAKALYNPIYEKVDLTSLLKRFEEKKKLDAFALSPVYWIVRSGDKLVLYRNQLPLGSFTFGRFFLNSECSDFEQELWDDLKLKVSNGR